MKILFKLFNIQSPSKFYYKNLERISPYIYPGIASSNPSVQKIIKVLKKESNRTGFSIDDLISRTKEAISLECIRDNEKVKKDIFSAIDEFFKNYLNHNKIKELNEDENEYLSLQDNIKKFFDNYDRGILHFIANLMEEEILKINRSSDLPNLYKGTSLKYGEVFSANANRLGVSYYDTSSNGFIIYNRGEQFDPVNHYKIFLQILKNEKNFHKRRSEKWQKGNYMAEVMELLKKITE